MFPGTRVGLLACSNSPFQKSVLDIELASRTGGSGGGLTAEINERIAASRLGPNWGWG